MIKLSKIETRFQELVLLFSLIFIPALFIALGSYLFFNNVALISILGHSGFDVLSEAYNTFGFSLYVIPLFSLGFCGFLIDRIQQPQDLLQSWKSIVLNIVADISFLVTVSSLLTIAQYYFNWSPLLKLSSTYGGSVGIMIGGKLFHSWGLVGSLTTLAILCLSLGIISGHVHLVNSLLVIKDVTVKVSIRLFNLASRDIWNFGMKVYNRLPFYHAKEDAEIEKILIETIMDDDLGPSVPNEVKKAINDLEMQELVDDTFEESTKEKKKKLKVVSKKEPKEEVETTEEKNKEIKEELVEEVKADVIEVSTWTKKYSHPEVTILKKAHKHKIPSESELKSLAKTLEERLASFSILGKVSSISPGIRLTMFEFIPSPGTKVSKIQSLSDDLAVLLGASSLRILAPIPGKTTIGIEIPNVDSTPLSFSEIIGDAIADKKKELPIAIGKDVFNQTITADLTEMPHLLIAGTTGSGKSVFTNTLISSLLFSKSPKHLRLILIDPKMIELSPYNGIPHLLKPVVTDLDEAKFALTWAMNEMDRRYNMLSEVGARNIISFNEIIESQTKSNLERRLKKTFSFKWEIMPYIVIVVDELADLMITQGKEVEKPITRLAQKARAAGIHLVLATQRPSSEIVTGLIKTNFPTRIAFKVSSSIDSRTIIDTSGAEKLLGHGDLLSMQSGKPLTRIQGSFISEEEVRKLVTFITDNN